MKRRVTAAPIPVHAEDCDRFLERLEVSSSAGLSAEVVAERQAEHGPNQLPEGKKKSALLRIGEQFINPLVLTLLAVFPANVNMAVNAQRFRAIPEPLLWARLPLQGALIAWVWAVALRR